VLDVTRLALAYRFEAEGLVFFPGFAPGRGMNVKGSTPNPVGRADYAMVE
ncbi:MAG: XRE family transcriptional regulator, partial [Pseudomonas sp.]